MLGCWALGPKIVCTFFGGPHDKEYRILGSMLGSPDLGKVPNTSRVPSWILGIYMKGV